MTIHEKAVIRYEAVCDACGYYVGEYSEKAEARVKLSGHFNQAVLQERNTGIKGEHVKWAPDPVA